jgi:hypothetical protein
MQQATVQLEKSQRHFDFVETVGQQLFASGQEQLDSSDSFVTQGYHSR